MRPLVAVLLCCHVLLVIPSKRGVRRFPYKAFVAADDVYVRSGPGQNYYPTDKLKRGQEVEVYRHDPGGWCAIRPVDGSFTWVSGRFLKPTRRQPGGGDGGGRVGPGRQPLQRHPRRGPGAVAEGRGGGDPRTAAARRPGRERVVQDCPALGRVPLGLGQVSRRRVSPRRRAKRHAERQAGTPTPIGSADGRPPQPGSDAADDSLRARSARPRSLTAEEFQAELDRIELELSVMVIEEPTAWSFDSLRERTNLLLDQAQTAVERGRARLLANKIARFDDIKQRQDAVLAMRDETDRSSRL